MKEMIFLDGMEQLSSFFGKNLMASQQDFYFKELGYISDSSFIFAVKTIQRNRKPNQSNFPTIDEIQGLCPTRTSEYSYNPDETDEQYYHRITVSYLWIALNILKDKGNEQFMRYCKSMHFSESDIDAVQCKFKMAYKDFRFKAKSIPLTVDRTTRINELQKQALALMSDSAPMPTS